MLEVDPERLAAPEVPDDLLALDETLSWLAADPRAAERSVTVNPRLSRVRYRRSPGDLSANVICPVSLS
jgi:hypothetical protein